MGEDLVTKYAQELAASAGALDLASTMLRHHREMVDHYAKSCEEYQLATETARAKLIEAVK